MPRPPRIASPQLGVSSSSPRAAGLGRHAPILRALADPTRLGMLEVLARAGGSLCVCEIEAGFQLSQPTVSHHLRILRQAGLVQARRRGTWMHYELQPQGLAEIARFAAECAALPRPSEGASDGEADAAGSGRATVR